MSSKRSNYTTQLIDTNYNFYINMLEQIKKAYIFVFFKYTHAPVQIVFNQASFYIYIYITVLAFRVHVRTVVSGLDASLCIRLSECSPFLGHE